MEIDFTEKEKEYIKGKGNLIDEDLEKFSLSQFLEFVPLINSNRIKEIYEKSLNSSVSKKIKERFGKVNSDVKKELIESSNNHEIEGE